MKQQLHKRFSDAEVKQVLEKFEKKTLTLDEVSRFLKVKRRRIFKLLKLYRQDPNGFSIEFARSKPPRRIDPKSEKKIVVELEKEAALIADKRNPVTFFNYSYLKNLLKEKHGVEVSLPTIISRAKKMGITPRRRLARPTTGKS
jgi:transposase